MGKSIDKGAFTFEMCSTLPAYGHKDYELNLTFERQISPDTVLMSTTTPVRASDLPGLTWARQESGTKYVRVKIPDGVRLEPSKPYVCIFSQAPANDHEADIKLKLALPADRWGVEKLVLQALKSWRFRFLGNHNINQWYKTYGEQAFSAVEQDPESVSRLMRLSPDKMLRLAGEVASIKSKWHHFKVLISHKFTLQEAEMVTDLLNAQVDATSRNDPFLLLTIRNVSKEFRHRYFNAMGVYERCKTHLPDMIAGYMDTFLVKKGDTAVPVTQAINELSDAFRMPKAVIEQCLNRMISQGHAELRTFNGVSIIGMGRLLAADMAVADGLAARDEDNSENPYWVEQFPVDRTPDGRTITLSIEQQVLIQTAFSASTSVCTGGPGTGKSTVMKSLIREIRRVNPTGRIFLAAPTGKAARRLTETTGEQSHTLHRLMGMTPGSSPALAGFNETDTLILDEASMMDIHLLASALIQTKARGRVIFSGDQNQLASIDTGAILHDMILSGGVAVAELTEPQRQALKSDIVSASYSIMAGRMPNLPGPGGDLHLVEASTPLEVSLRIKELVTDVIPHSYGIHHDNIQILAAMRKGEAGINKLNESLKPIFNEASRYSETPSRNLGSQTYHIGDRVMQLKNRYDLDIQNGEVGTIVAFDERKKAVMLRIDDRIIPLPFDNYPYMTHSWGMTVHKSQGSEYPCVILSLPDDHIFMLDRSIAFTAITRAKMQCFIVGSKDTLEQVIKKKTTRLTLLPFLIAEKIAERSQHLVFQNMAKNSKRNPTPKPVHTVTTVDAYTPF